MKFISSLLVILLALLLASCSDSGEGLFTTLDTSTVLIAGQQYEVGVVNVQNDDIAVTVSYHITDAAWCLQETHIFLSVDAPSKASPGQFPYGADSLDCVTSYTETISLSDLNATLGDTLNVATHAVVQGPSNETAWGFGPNQFRHGWGWYFTYDVEGGVVF